MLVIQNETPEFVKEKLSSFCKKNELEFTPIFWTQLFSPYIESINQVLI